MIQRPIYLQQLIAHREQKIIKVVTGVRRCGKSTLFELYQHYLRSTGVDDDQIVAINLEDLENDALLDDKSLYRHVRERLCKNRYTYVFIDEIQQCESFEKAVDSLFIRDRVDVYITGSNAHMLSGELATLLSGRYITIEMLPLSFGEYMGLHASDQKPLAQYFNAYLTLGSFPHVAMLEQTTVMVRPYVEGIYNTILIKDVAMRQGIKDISILESIVKILASGIGSPISTKKIADTLSSAGRSISANTVDNYVRALTDSFIYYRVDRYDIKGRQHLKTLGKYYIVDTGIRQLLLAQGSTDMGHLIENIVYLELRRRYTRIHVGKLGPQEVDFIVEGPSGYAYFQVAATVLHEDTLQHELDPLRKIDDNYPKTLITLDEIGSGSDHQGIRQVNLITWLLEQS